MLDHWSRSIAISLTLFDCRTSQEPCPLNLADVLFGCFEMDTEVDDLCRFLENIEIECRSFFPPSYGVGIFPCFIHVPIDALPSHQAAFVGHPNMFERSSERLFRRETMNASSFAAYTSVLPLFRRFYLAAGLFQRSQIHFKLYSHMRLKAVIRNTMLESDVKWAALQNVSSSSKGPPSGTSKPSCGHGQHESDTN